MQPAPNKLLFEVTLAITSVGGFFGLKLYYVSPINLRASDKSGQGPTL